MIIYEVNSKVNNQIADDYIAWLSDHHIPLMMAIDGFVNATIYEELNPDDPNHRYWCTHYELTSAAALQNYLDNHAAKMRGDGMARFGDQFSATRRILKP